MSASFRKNAKPSRHRFRRLRRRLFPRGLSFTREGKIYVAVTLGVGFAAVNTGNNLLFLVLGLMLGLIIASGILSEIVLRDIAIRRRLPRRAVAGVVFPVELFLKNEKRRLCSYSVELRDEIDGEAFKRRCFFLRVGPGEERSIAYRCELPRRGLARFDGVIVSTRFPFGLFEKRRYVELPAEVIALPAPLPVPFPVEAIAVGTGERSSGRRGSGQDFLELRQMGPTDDPRRIHWPSTARTGTFWIRENEAEAMGFVEIVLDPSPRDDRPESLDRVELDIRAVGSVVRAAVDRGLVVRLVTPPSAVLRADGRESALGLLEHLALLDPEAAASAPPPAALGPAALLVGPRARGTGRTTRLEVPATVAGRA